jgi:transposase
MSRKVRRYTKEFREEAVKLALQSKAFSKTAKDLGIPTATVTTWVRQLKNRLITKDDALPNVHHLLEENRRLHKELSIVKEEREILKKASAYFALHLK